MKKKEGGEEARWPRWRTVKRREQRRGGGGGGKEATR